MHKKLSTTRYDVVSNKINDAVRLVQLTDLHNNVFGYKNIQLIDRVLISKPDIIAITGDVFCDDNNITTKNLINQLVDIAPIYFSPGNHEYDLTGAFEKKV